MLATARPSCLFTWEGVSVRVQLVGCTLLAVGIWAKVDEGSLADIIQGEDAAHKMSVLAWVIIVVGAIICVIGFLGCCGAIRESQCLLATVRMPISIYIAVTARARTRLYKQEALLWQRDRATRLSV